MKGYLILVFNLSHPTKELAPFLVMEEEDKALIFTHYGDAKYWIECYGRAPFAYSIIDVEKIDFTSY